jgi:hypothetical protein
MELSAIWTEVMQNGDKDVDISFLVLVVEDRFQPSGTLGGGGPVGVKKLDITCWCFRAVGKNREEKSSSFAPCQPFRYTEIGQGCDVTTTKMWLSSLNTTPSTLLEQEVDIYLSLESRRTFVDQDTQRWRSS